MPVIATFVPFILTVTIYGFTANLHYKADSGDFSIFTTPKQGYETSTLYAEAETKTFHANESDTFVTFMYLEEVKIFLKDSNNARNYLKLDQSTKVIHVTTDKEEASLFTLATTKELHSTGSFQIVFSPGFSSENATSIEENLIHDALEMEQDLTKENHSTSGPYRLVSRPVNSPVDIYGVSTTLPELHP